MSESLKPWVMIDPEMAWDYDRLLGDFETEDEARAEVAKWSESGVTRYLVAHLVSTPNA